MSHIVNVIQKTDIKKSLVMLMQESKKQNSKIKIKKDEIILNLENDSWLIFYGNTKTLLKIENKNHSSFNFDTHKNSVKKQLNLSATPLELEQKQLSSYTSELQTNNNRMKIKEVQLSLKRNKSRLILEKVN